MSKYVSSLRSEGPSSLYIFNKKVPATATDEGKAGQDLSLIESGFSASPVPSIVPGEHWSVYTPVGYDFDGAVPANSYCSYKNNSFADWEDFHNLDDDFTIEATFVTGYSTRSQGAGPVWGFYDGTTAGTWLETEETTDGWNVAIKVNLSEGESTLVSHEVGRGELVHAVVIKTERNFVLLVNGHIRGTAQVPVDADLAPGTYDDFNVAGDDAVRHSNIAALAAVMLSKRSLPYRRIEERYGYLTERKSLLDVVSGYGPLGVLFPEKSGKAVLAPRLDDLFEGADDDLEYKANNRVTIKDSSLAAGFTAEKKLAFNLTDIEAIGPVYHDFDSSTSGSSSVVAEYSFDDVVYDTLPTGADAIAEISQDWAQAEEGSL